MGANVTLGLARVSSAVQGLTPSRDSEWQRLQREQCLGIAIHIGVRQAGEPREPDSSDHSFTPFTKLA